MILVKQQLLFNKQFNILFLGHFHAVDYDGYDGLFDSIDE